MIPTGRWPGGEAAPERGPAPHSAGRDSVDPPEVASGAAETPGPSRAGPSLGRRGRSSGIVQ